MKIIITENQNYILRRLTSFIEIVEEQIEGYESQDDKSFWWCSAVYNPDIFVDALIERCINIFIEENWYFFHDNTDRGGANMDISVLNKIVEENYGNYIRNLWVKKCGKSRF